MPPLAPITILAVLGVGVVADVCSGIFIIAV
jgi:hypothetical protein